MTVPEFIEKYRISLNENGGLVAHDVSKTENNAVLAFAKKNRKKIVSYLSDNKKKKEILSAMREGLEFVNRAIAARNSKLTTLASMESRGVKVSDKQIEKIEKDFKEEVSQYPFEYAYVRAQRMVESSNKWRRLAGERAIRKLLAGENAEKVMERMEKEWRDDYSKDFETDLCMQSREPYSIMSRTERGARTANRAVAMA